MSHPLATPAQRADRPPLDSYSMAALWRLIDRLTWSMRCAESDGDRASYARYEARWNAAWDEVEARERRQEERRQRAAQRKERGTEVAA